ncbi:2-hydroxymethylglutarate dehydrogenase [Cupriavidus sp. TA19]|uniref:NAD(P)-dependent oxidoreductase n=1 Tax=unclassified Cupriavidus TaxID=2640874 RepID=UPI002729420F|nr:NAD(P)-dependent oxidoreductase [Cupriavidus sp. TA19]GLC96781.1 2-hydroxymethylglutarate dehydrogenase [Cupriavidus sp. TA19]
MSAANSDRTIVGFVGLGQMGKPMALNLLHADTDLRVTSKVRDAYPALQAAGATTAESLAGIADARIVFLSLPGTAAVMDVLFGEGGLTSLLRPGAVVVDTSTMEHGATLDIHSRLAAASIAFLDAPVSGMQSRAEAGTLTVMCGGAKEAFETVKPWLERMGNNILYMGDAGSGQLTKLVNQLLFDINCAALAEILPMARRMGLDAEKIASVINSGTGRSYASEFFLSRILARHFSDGYPLQAAYKDLVSAAELGARHCIPMPVLAAATATYQMSLLTGHGASDKGSMTRFFEDMLAVQFSAAAPHTET